MLGEQGLHFDKTHRQGGRQGRGLGEPWIEWYETNPAEQPDPGEWVTHLTFQLASSRQRLAQHLASVSLDRPSDSDERSSPTETLVNLARKAFPYLAKRRPLADRCA